MPFTTKKINMVIHTNSATVQNSNTFSNNNYINNNNNGSGFSSRSVRNVFNNPMIDRIQHAKSGCSSCGGAK